MRIEEDNITVESLKDVVKTKNGWTCGCGDPKLEMTDGIDGADFYLAEFECKCGNVLYIVFPDEMDFIEWRNRQGGEQ